MSIRKLNIVMSYPIKWDVYHVMNNYVQNFYDAVGCENFMQHFKYKFEDSTIILESDVGFSKEWLFFMGASTKRDGSKTYAGRFGEGFKVASLIAYRDLGLGIYMESRDWTLKVTQTDDLIDGVEVKVLAYDIGEREYDESAKLILTNAQSSHFEELRNQIDHFYYDKNEKFGRLISKGTDYAIYNSVKKNREKKNYGSLFINYQYRGSLDLPIVVCNHNYLISGDDRDRFSLTLNDSNSAIRKVFEKVNAGEALVLLEICKPRWKNTYGTDFYGRNWYTMLEILIRKVANNPDTRKEFLSKYQDEIVVTGFGRYIDRFKKKMAQEWFRNSKYYNQFKIVSEVFNEFDLKSIYGLCAENNGFDEDAEPSDLQKKYIELLEKIANQFFDSLFCYESLPNCRILLNKEAPILGKAHSIKEKDKIKNVYGHVVKTRVSNIYIQAHILGKNTFSEALVVYLHEILHQFGGDSSRQFKDVLVQMNRILLMNLSEIKRYEQNWVEIERITN